MTQRRDGTGGPSANADTELVHPLSIPAIAPDDTALDAALKYAGAGWYVLPVRRGTTNPGSVVCTAWPMKSSRDPRQIVAWMAATDHGVALHCGRSGAVVFDVHDPEALPDVLVRYLCSAPFQSTRPDCPGRGHYVFAIRPGRTIGYGAIRFGGAWGQVRGVNGVIMAAPSIHPRGAVCRWERVSHSLPVLPDEIAGMLDDASSGFRWRA